LALVVFFLVALVSAVPASAADDRAAGDTGVAVTGLSRRAGPALSTDDLPMSRLVRDYRALRSLADTGDALCVEMNGHLQRLRNAETLTIEDEEALARWMFANRNLRRALGQIAERWRNWATQPGVSPLKQEKALQVSFAALLEWYRNCVYLSAGPQKFKIVRRKLNERVPELDLPADQLDAMMAPLGNHDLAEQIEDGYQQIAAVIAREGTTNRPMQARMEANYKFITQYAPNPWKMRVRNWWQTFLHTTRNRYYRAEAALFTWVGDSKYKRHAPSIKHERIREMTAKLQPGDILLERENWFMSNIFLPGFWPHAILYVGTVDDLRKLGLDREPIVAAHLQAMDENDDHGHTRRVVEAVSDGVVMSSMEEATDADYICAFRPRLSQEQIKAVIVEAFRHVGKPYDFEFDFQTADKLVCSELIYRAFRGKLPLNLKRTMGRWAMPTDDLVRLFTNERVSPERNLDFVFFLDSDPKTGQTMFRDAEALCQTLKRPGFDWQQKSLPNP